jgi:superfamily II RNA helicase
VSERQNGRGRRRGQDERADAGGGARPRKRRAGAGAGRSEERASPRPSARPPQPLPAFSYEALAAVERFAAGEPFPLDPFQLEAARHLADRRSVLVAAPTGTGKTVLAEFAIWQARGAGQRAIYTAPLKALSNQKFRDFRVRYGASEVGLLTGDIVENPRAPIVVMTTEIYRNMLLEGLRAARTPPAEVEAAALLSPLAERAGAEDDGQVAADDVAELARRTALDEELSDVGCVIFDELHYLSDPSRGPVWEEAIIHSPRHITLVGLSATVSNADELRRWIEHVHGPTALVFHTERAVPLEHYFFLDGALHLVQDAGGRRVERFPTIGGEAKLARQRNRLRRYAALDDEDEDEPLARVTVFTSEARAAEPAGDAQRGEGQSAEQAQPEVPRERQAPEPGEALTALRDAGLLPCIYFLPGRKAVEVAAEGAKGHLLTDPDQRARLHEEVQEWVGRLPSDDQKLDQVKRLAALLPRGIAYHHAGLLPGLKVMVETLFQRGALRAVFATDTLALGINMPARSVVLGSTSKFDGVQMRLMTPNEYQQLTGRAGRRGMDAKGAAVLLYSPWDAFEPSFAALTAPLLPVTSAFTVRYNTVLNLWRAYDIARLRDALAASLREFQRRGGAYQARRDIEFDAAGPRRESHQQRRQRARRGQKLSRAAVAELEGTVAVLRALRYIGQDDELTVKGRLLRALFHPAGMVLVELLVGGAFDGLTPPELAEAISWFTFDDDRPLRNSNYLSQRLLQLRREITGTRLRVVQAEYEEGLAPSPGIMEAFHGVALNWHRGFSLGGLLRRIDLAEGDLLVVLNQTIDLLQQVQGAVGQTLDARDLWAEASDATRSGRFLLETRRRLAALRPTLDAGWRGMLRGSVAQSRAIPAMTTPVPAAPEAEAGPALPMAEDEDPAEAAQDRREAPPNASGEDVSRLE